MLVLPVAYYIIFRYIPMVGNVLAFRRYRPGKSMFGTEWTLAYFERFLGDPTFWKAFKNTIVLSLSNLAINFPIPIIFAIALNEIRWTPFKKFAQTASYIPRFVSTVVVIAILNEFLSPSSGFLNMLLKEFGIEPIYFMRIGISVSYPAAAAAGKSLQSCPTLCEPIDGSPPGSAIPGILLARVCIPVADSF